MRQEINLTITSDTFLYISSTGTDDEQVQLASYSLKLSRCWHVYKWHTEERVRAKLAVVSE